MTNSSIGQGDMQATPITRFSHSNDGNPWTKIRAFLLLGEHSRQGVVHESTALEPIVLNDKNIGI